MLLKQRPNELSDTVQKGVGYGFSLLLAALGLEHGIYDALAESRERETKGESQVTHNGWTAAELAKRTDLVERYVADWLANQLAAGFVTLVKPTNTAPAPNPESEDAAEKEAGVRSEDTPRFTLSEAQRNVFARPSHPSYLGSLAFLASGFAHSLVNRMPTELRERRGIAWGEHSPHLFRFFELMRKSPAFQTNVLDRVVAAIPADLRARMDCAPQDRPDVHQVLALDVATARDSRCAHWLLASLACFGRDSTPTDHPLKAPSDWL